MPYSRPSLPSLIARFRADWRSRAAIGDSWLRRTVEGILAIAVPGLTHGLHGHLAWIAKQIIFDTAEIEQVLRWARIFGLTRKDPTKATLTVTFGGADGSVLSAGQVMQLADGTRFVVATDATVASDIVTATVVAETAGLVSVQAGAAVALTTTVVGVNASGTVTVALGAGTNLETKDELLARLLNRIQTPPRGGGPGDYVTWALEVAGVTRAWEYPRMNGLGTVGVAFVNDNDDIIVPGSLKIAEVQSYIEARMPVTATLDVFALTEVPLNPTLSITPNTTAVKDAAEAELRELLRREAEPGGTVLISHVRAAISAAADEVDYALASPSADFTCDPNEIVVLGTITWT